MSSARGRPRKSSPAPRSSSRAAAGSPNGSERNSRSAGPRHSASASFRPPTAARAFPRLSCSRAAAASDSNRSTSSSPSSPRSSSPGGRVTSRSGPSALRSCDTYTWSVFVARAGGPSPQSSSTSRPGGTTRVRFRRSSASSARGFGAASRVGSPRTKASSGPRSRNSSMRPGLGRPRDVCPRDLLRPRAPEEREAEADLLAEELEHVPGSLLAAGCESPDDGAAGEDGAGAERERLDRVCPSPDAAVEVDLDAAADRLCDLRQGVERRGHAVELPPPVVRDDDGRGAVLACKPRVLGGEDALDDDREPRRGREPLHVVPADGRAEEREVLVELERLERAAGVVDGGDPDVVGDRESGAERALAAPQVGRVGGEDEGREARFDRLLDERGSHVPVLEDVELEPARRIGSGRRELGGGRPGQCPEAPHPPRPRRGP